VSAIDELITELARLPGIGRKTAQRLTFHLLQQPPEMVGRLAAALVVSAAAQLAVLPISLAHFNQLSTIGVLANLAVVPLAGLATVLGLVAVAAGLAVRHHRISRAEAAPSAAGKPSTTVSIRSSPNGRPSARPKVHST